MFQNPYAKYRILNSCLLLWWRILYKFLLVLKRLMSSLKPTLTLPPGTKPLDNQVAGHQTADGKIGTVSHIVCLSDTILMNPYTFNRYKSMQLSLIININAMCCQMIVNTNNIIGPCPYLSSMAMAKTKRKKI